MPHTWRGSPAALLLAVLLIPLSVEAYDHPISDTAVRSAYFLGQRHDQSMRQFLDRYTKHLPAPKAGPYISSVTLLTPFAQLVKYSDHYIGNFSAQQAQLDHRQACDEVKLILEIQLTASYGPFVSSDGKSLPNSAFGAEPRSSDFWRDFTISFLDGRDLRIPVRISGRPNYFCNKRGNCTLSGATVVFNFDPDSLKSDTLSVQVIPPEGVLVAVEVALDSLR